MRHRKRGRKLGRNASHRTAMFRNMANSFFEHERIVTTVAKAKELRPYVEKLITKAREGARANVEAQKLREKAGDHDKRAQDLLEEARRRGVDTDAGKETLEKRRAVLEERYQLLAEWRRAVAPVLHARRQLISRLGRQPLDEDDNHDNVVQKLIEEIGPRYLDRPGGYTRVLRLTQRRLGDAGQTALIELVADQPAAAPRAGKRGDQKNRPTEAAAEE